MPADTSTLRPLLAAQPGLLFAVLVGSRATGKAQPGSDWDIALQWDFALPWLEALIENAIGKAKRMLKEQGQPVPVSDYDTFGAVVTHGLLPSGM